MNWRISKGNTNYNCPRCGSQIIRYGTTFWCLHCDRKFKEENLEVDKMSKVDIQTAIGISISSAQVNILLAWMAATMATIAAINSLIPNYWYRAIVFLIVGASSILLKTKVFK